MLYTALDIGLVCCGAIVGETECDIHSTGSHTQYKEIRCKPWAKNFLLRRNYLWVWLCMCVCVCVYRRVIIDIKDMNKVFFSRAKWKFSDLFVNSLCPHVCVSAFMECVIRFDGENGDTQDKVVQKVSNVFHIHTHGNFSFIILIDERYHLIVSV